MPTVEEEMLAELVGIKAELISINARMMVNHSEAADFLILFLGCMLGAWSAYFVVKGFDKFFS